MLCPAARYLFRAASFGAALLAVSGLPASHNPRGTAVAVSRQVTGLDQDSIAAALRSAIAGREYELAELVFRNVRVLRQIPASRLISTMQYIYSRGLGVDCRHCHDISQWEKDDLDVKKIAREMISLTGAVNNDLIRSSPLLSARRATVTCSTCHRGEPRPTAGSGSKE